MVLDDGESRRDLPLVLPHAHREYGVGQPIDLGELLGSLQMWSLIERPGPKIVSARGRIVHRFDRVVELASWRVGDRMYIA